MYRQALQINVYAAAAAAAAAESLQSCPTLSDPMDCSPPGSSVPGILQARVLEWVAMPSSRGSSQPRDQTLTSSASAGTFPPLAPPRAKLPNGDQGSPVKRRDSVRIRKDPDNSFLEPKPLDGEGKYPPGLL